MQVILPAFVPSVATIYLFDPIAYTSWVSPLTFNSSMAYAPLSSDLIFVHCTHAPLSFIFVPNQFTVYFSIAPLSFIVYYCLNICFWQYFLTFVFLITSLIFNCIFFTQVLFIISHHSSLICFIVINDVFYDVFLFIDFLVCLLQFYL